MKCSKTRVSATNVYLNNWSETCSVSHYICIRTIVCRILLLCRNIICGSKLYIDVQYVAIECNNWPTVSCNLVLSNFTSVLRECDKRMLEQLKWDISVSNYCVFEQSCVDFYFIVMSQHCLSQYRLYRL